IHQSNLMLQHYNLKRFEKSAHQEYGAAQLDIGLYCQRGVGTGSYGSWPICIRISDIPNATSLNIKAHMGPKKMQLGIRKSREIDFISNERARGYGRGCMYIRRVRPIYIIATTSMYDTVLGDGENEEYIGGRQCLYVSFSIWVLTYLYSLALIY
ncbi:761_t:CDS:1, partial [Paraglomus brasilianum]